MPHSHSIASPRPAISHGKLTASLTLQLAGAFAFGMFLLVAAGFVPIEAVHNAAHDARHALAFPCH